MRVVIDTNSLQSEELRIFLGADPTNMAILPEHTTAEMFKASALDAIYATHSILCLFPKQVVTLHGNRRAVRVNARAPAIANRFIDKSTTRAFPTFCEHLKAAEDGHEGMRRQLVERQRWALNQAKTVEDAFGDQSEALATLRAQFNPADLRRMGAQEPLSEQGRGVVLGLTLHLATTVCAAHSPKIIIPEPPHRYNHFGWRYSLCHVIQLLQLMRKGSVRRAPTKARNDHFDNVFATFGTYFNGVMSDDTGTLGTQAIARVILKALSTRLAPDYIETGYILEALDAMKGREGVSAAAIKSAPAG